MSKIAKKNEEVHHRKNKAMVEIWRKCWKANRDRALSALGEQVKAIRERQELENESNRD